MLIALVSCQTGQAPDHVFTAPQTYTPPAIFKAGKPVVHHLSDKPSPEIVDLSQKPKPSDIQTDFFITMKNFNTEDGLALSSIRSSFKDKSGNLWFGTFGNGVSKYDGMAFTNYSMAHGLVHNYIKTITQDRKGNIWFGSYGGASRYNGVYFENFTTEQGLPDNHVYKIIEDKNGHIWFATMEGVSRYIENENDDRKGEFINYDERQGLFGNYASDIMEDRDGDLWVAGKKGVFKFDPSAEASGKKPFAAMGKIPDMGDQLVHCIAEDSYGTLWFGTNEGVVRYTSAGADQYESSFVHYTVKDGLISNKITSMLEDQAGNLWLGSDEGVSEFIREDSLFMNYTTRHGLTDNFIACMVEDDSGSIWLGTKGNGLIRLDGRSTIEYSSRQGLPGETVYAVALDQNNHIWIGAENGGITKFIPRNQNMGSLVNYSTAQGLKSGDAMNMMFDREGNLWYGSDHGLSRFSNQSVITTWDTLQGLSSNRVISLMEDSEGNIWFGTFESGVSRFNGKTISSYTTEQGLLHNTVWNIHEDENGVLWFATRGGLSRFDGENFVNFTTQQGLPDNKLSVVKQDRYGNLLIGTWGGGISVIRKKWMEMPDKSNFSFMQQNIFENYNSNHGLPNDVIYGILEDDEGNIIIGTSYGFTMLKGGLSAEKGQIALDGVENYNQQTGYPIKDVSNNYTMVLDQKGFLWAGTGQKLVRFDYNQVRRNAKPPEVMIQRVSVNYEPVSWHTLHRAKASERDINDLPHRVPAYVHNELHLFGKQLDKNERDTFIRKFRNIRFDDVSPFSAIPQNLVLPYMHNSISFDFLGVETTRPFLVQYQFMLEGNENTWSPPGTKTSVEYSNLGQGSYTFKLRAKGPSGIWSEPISFGFRVLPPWWFTWWSISLYTLIVLVVILGIRRYEMNRLNLRNELELEKVTTDSLRNLDQLKTYFFANISHEFRTPLTLILGQVQSVMSSGIEIREKSKLQVANRNAKRLLKLTNELLDLSKLESGNMEINTQSQNVVPFLRSLFFSFESLAESKKIDIAFESESDRIFVSGDPDKMEKIFNNLLSNAFKFTPENGKVTVSVSVVKDQWVTICVRDDGIGIPRDRVGHVFDRFYQVDGSHTRENEGTGIGLALTRELVELHKGTITVVSTENVGSEFIVSLPLDVEGYKKGEVMKGDSQVKDSLNDLKDPSSVTNGEKYNSQTLVPEKNENEELVLIVEDNDDVRAYIKDSLIENFRVLEASNGEEGVKKAQKQIPDLIISDVMMPKMDGYQFCKAIRMSEKTSHIPLIMLTAKAGLDDRINGLETGVDTYLTKPFSARELNANVKNLIQQRAQLRKRFSKSTMITPSEVHASSTDQLFLNKILKIIEKHFEDEQFSVETLAGQVNMSVSQLNRKLNALVGQPPGQLIRSFRLQRAAEMLSRHAGSVSEICYQVGFSDNAYFSRAFKKQFKCSPSEYSEAN